MTDWLPPISQFLEFEEVLRRLQDKKDRLSTARPLPTSAVAKIRDSLNLEWTYNSNSIEGNSLTLRETHMVINEGMTVKGKSLREHFETYNHDKALSLLYKLVEQRSSLSAKQVLELHEVVLRNIEEDYAGRLRTGGVRIIGANFIPPNARKVATLLDELMDFVTTHKGYDTLSMATILHHRFVWIHPFFDGNGRTIRLVMNLFLMQQGYPPAIILKNDRKKYYTALNKANKGDYRKLFLLISQAVERSLNIYLSIIPDTEDYLPIAEVVKEPSIPYGQEYVSLLARRGKIDAYKEGRNWVTTKEAVLAYIASQ